MLTDQASPVLFAADGQVGHIVLNRPEALNALTLDMIRLVDAALDRFLADTSIAVVTIQGAGDRAFCAGGDMRSIHRAVLAGDPYPRTFWSEEYRLNARIATYAKPIVALMDGIVMGGGVGIGSHASHRVVTERSVVAMPEVGIGFAPDVGGTYLLSRSPGQLGLHVALTASRLTAADAIYCGLADHQVAAGDIAQLLLALRTGDPREAIIAASSRPSEGELSKSRAWIDRCYSGHAVEDIIGRLVSAGSEAATAGRTIQSMSPTSLKVTLRAIRMAERLAKLEDCLEMEYRISTAFLETPDFIEGVRAALVDKDRSPRWDPPDLEGVTDLELDRFFETKPDDLQLA